jgi:putative tricarboxylic transport membrane protein
MATDWSKYRRPPALGDAAVGAGVVALAGVLAWAVLQIPASPLYARVGPTLFPWIAVCGLAMLGVALTVVGLRGGWEHEEAPGRIDLRGGLTFAAGLVLQVATIEFVGFILATTLLFVMTARAFDSSRILRDAAIGFALSTCAYVGFDKVLGYRIGSGLVEQFIGRIL